MKEQLQLLPGHLGAIWHYRPRRVHPSHHHADLEVNIVLRGTASYIVQNARHDLQPGSIIWLFPRQEHVLLDASQDFEMLIAVARPRLIQQITRTPETQTLRQLNPAGPFVKTLTAPQLQQLRLRFHEITAYEPHADLYNAGLSYAFLSAWHLFQTAESAIARDLHPSVEKAARILQTADASLSLEQLAADVALSPSRLSRLFHAQTGISLVAFRQRRQLDRFLSLYPGNGQIRILDAALRAGFGSYPQFHRVFVKHIGKSPAAYFRRAASPSATKSL